MKNYAYKIVVFLRVEDQEAGQELGEALMRGYEITHVQPFSAGGALYVLRKETQS